MGHYRRELDPEGAAEEDRRIDRTLKLKEGLKDVPIGAFTVSEFDSLRRVKGWQRGALGHVDPSDEDLTIVEQRLRQIKEKS